MRANFIHIEPMARGILEAGIHGDFAEFGVWHGTTFIPLAELARQNDRTIHAVDSFQGMAKETDRDGNRFRKGALSVGGSEVFRRLAHPFPNIEIHEGFIPVVLAELNDVEFAFVHLDVDQYSPTADSLAFVWERMVDGGILICHDWFRNDDTLAAGAILDWMNRAEVSPLGECSMSHHIWFRKQGQSGGRV